MTYPTSRAATSTLPVITGLFVAVLLTSNIASSAKMFAIGPFVFPGGIVVFPLNLMFGDILTEVYGFARSRMVIWVGFSGLVLASFALLLVQHLPSAPFWNGQVEYERVLGFMPRMAVASLLAYIAGDFCNSYILSRMKYAQHGRAGRARAARFIFSTVVGEAVDSMVFVFVAFLGTAAVSEIAWIALSAYGFKLTYEVVATPMTTRLAGWLIAVEGNDVIDRLDHINYNPFSCSLSRNYRSDSEKAGEHECTS